MKKITTLQLILFSTGGMIGSGWLFSPFYGFQTAGVWVLLSWLITAILTFVIALSFAETSCLMPIVGGGVRFIGVTHNKTLGFVFLLLGWLSLVVYLPLEVQSSVQYLGFWVKSLITHDGTRVVLSTYGLMFSLGLMVFLTILNCFLISNVTKINSFMGTWKIIIPIGVALFFIIFYGKPSHIISNFHHIPFSMEKVLLAITSSGLAFAFTGFQNGLIMAHETENPGKSLPISLFSPVILGSIIYMLLSFSFICCLSNPNEISHSVVAPLLGLVTLFSMNVIYVILFADAIAAPLGTANVYTAITGRVLYGLALDFMPKSTLTKINRFKSPHFALSVSALIGMIFLLPLPTWTELVDFLSSIVVLAYITGPITLMVLRREFPELKRNFRVLSYQLIGYLGFIFCGLFIYWSGLKNLILLSVAVILAVFIYAVITNRIFKSLRDGVSLICYVLVLAWISLLRNRNYIPFPEDNILVIITSIIYCFILTKTSLPRNEIQSNLESLNI